MSSLKIRLGLSPCPNDTFICDALLNQKIDTEGLEFEAVFADIESLNHMAFRKEIDLVKVSYHAFLSLAKDYLLLESGSALGHDCGPLVIADKEFELHNIGGLSVVIPGKFTTANLLFTLAFPDVTNKTEMLFSDIPEAVARKKADLGLLIHESRFTYQQKGLKTIMDLGSFWEGMTGHPVPLGAYIISRKTSVTLQEKINRVLRRSVEYAIENPESSNEFVKSQAQEMDNEVISAHIGLYVNQYTRALGEEGHDAIYSLFSEAHDAGIDVYQSRDFFAKC